MKKNTTQVSSHVQYRLKGVYAQPSKLEQLQALLKQQPSLKQEYKLRQIETPFGTTEIFPMTDMQHYIYDLYIKSLKVIHSLRETLNQEQSPQANDDYSQLSIQQLPPSKPSTEEEGL